ncbi:DUF4157 domain-containing protein, partial [Actinosynnema sp. NPDC023658]|uniref:eCIS core domain-containing protein n=1 Tax=Actinosynnema sp. NPDC023658 TaxID=3155465 RepID=UPI0033C808A0
MRDQDHNADEKGRGAVRPAPPDWSEPGGLSELQRSVGNAATSRFVEFARRADEAFGDGPQVQRSSVEEVVGRRGGSLPPEVQRFAEASYGEDFSGVQVHSDGAAMRSAKELRARAYTTGEHVVAPRDLDMHTWLHELDHVRTQRRGLVEGGTDRGDGVRVSHPSDEQEKAADVNATRALEGNAAHVGHQHAGHQHSDHAAPQSGGGAVTVQRTPATWSQESDTRAAERLQAGRPGIGQQQSFWPPIVALVQRYAGLPSADTAARTRVLDELDGAIQEWERNQNSRGMAVLNRSASEQKRAVIVGLRRLMGGERQEITFLEEQEANPPRTPSPETGATTTAGRGSPEQSSSGDDESIPEVEPARLMRTRRRLEGVPPLPDGVQTFVHVTGEEIQFGIRTEGLRPGAGEGIGLPEGGSDAYNTYVVSGSPEALSMVTSEAGSGVVGVIGSGVTPDRDPNYRGGAYRFQGGMDPVRRAGRSEGGGPFSFTLPASAKERRGIHTFVNNVLASSRKDPIAEEDAYK